MFNTLTCVYNDKVLGMKKYYRSPLTQRLKLSLKTKTKQKQTNEKPNRQTKTVKRKLKV